MKRSYKLRYRKISVWIELLLNKSFKSPPQKNHYWLHSGRGYYSALQEIIIKKTQRGRISKPPKFKSWSMSLPWLVSQVLYRVYPEGRTRARPSAGCHKFPSNKFIASIRQVPTLSAVFSTSVRTPGSFFFFHRVCVPKSINLSRSWPQQIVSLLVIWWPAVFIQR